jgi:DNA-binding MarR family transcriptional regulator
MKIDLQTIALLRRLRDWPKSQRPFSQLIVMLALYHAGEPGLRSGDLACHLGRLHGNSAGVFLQQLVDARMVAGHESPRRRSTRIYTLTAHGRREVESLLHVEAVMVPEPMPA